ncbi:hypothetical protein Fmac_005258 [Flemingia macrophylla]|uniref:Uncharacterized protein n=1 Tax=Flemingia macrophylla TaxID=520843 RepID=A0ABD1N7L4_9FABA
MCCLVVSILVAEEVKQEKEKAKMGARLVVIRRRRDIISNSYLSNRNISGRLIPKRGQVKLGIVVGLCHTVSSVFSSVTTRCVQYLS